MNAGQHLWAQRLTAALLFLAGRAARSALAPDPAKIRRLVTGMARGFDEASAKRSVAGLAPEWRDPESDFDRELLRLVLA